MNTQSLASAFSHALNRSAAARPADIPDNRDTSLLAALERSATARDQIVQRRIGIATEAPAQPA